MVASTPVVRQLKQTVVDEWVAARSRYRLSHAHVQMARELGMNPRKLGGIANDRQEPWKAPLPVFIEDCYEKRFGRRAPTTVVSIEDAARTKKRMHEARKAARRARRKEAGAAPGSVMASTSETDGGKPPE